MGPDNLVYVADRALQLLLRDPVLQQNALLHAIARAFNWWGGPGVIWCAVLLWLGGRAMRRMRLAELGLRAAEGIAIASAISGITKGFTGRSRPFLTPLEPWHWDFAHGWTDARYFSMPSGHTTASFAFAASVVVATRRTWHTGQRLALSVASLAAAALVALARTYLDQHWLSDVGAGAVLGGAVGFALARWHARHPGTPFDRTLLGATAPEAA